MNRDSAQHRLAVIAAIAGAAACFTYIYVSLWGFVGRFPAESLPVIRADSSAARALCYDPAYTRRDIAPGAPGRRGGGMLALPVSGRPSSGAELGRIAGSGALFYSVFDRTIYVIDRPSESDLSALDQLVFWGILNPRAVKTTRASAMRFAPRCTVPSSDRGITEAYWATKGTSVLHHWAFLYDSSFNDGKPVHAQYGQLVSRVSRGIAVARNMPGPTGFVRTAWIVYWFIGIVAMAAFLVVFRANSLIATIGLAAEVYAFASLGTFSILLAPGYHWFRELVMLLPAVLVTLAQAWSGKPRAALTIGIASTLAAVLGYLLDPSFTLAAAGAFAVAAVARYYRALRAFAAARPLRSGLVLAAAGIAIAGLVLIDRSNVGYVLAKITGFASLVFSDPGRTNVVLANFALAALTIVLVANKRLTLLHGYFAVFSVVAYTFYVVTPDRFHFIKYLAYVIPLYVVLGITLYDRIVVRFVPGALRFARPLLALCAFALLVAGLQKLGAEPPYWELRTVDSLGLPYFSSAPFEINGRIIDADLNAETVARLRSFPATTPADYIVSPLDKYIVFLYDEHNGFDSVDAKAWMESDSRLAAIEDSLARRHARVLLDTSVFDVDPVAAILSNHPVLGSDNSQSILDVKARVRMSELAAYIEAHCAPAPQARDRPWLSVRC